MAGITSWVVPCDKKNMKSYTNSTESKNYKSGRGFSRDFFIAGRTSRKNFQVFFSFFSFARLKNMLKCSILNDCLISKKHLHLEFTLL